MGLEAQYWNFRYDTSSAITASLFPAGPVLSYSAEDWWTTLTFLPQLVNFRGSGLDLVNSQRTQIQLGFSIALDVQPASKNIFLPMPTEMDAERLSKISNAVSLEDLIKSRNFTQITAKSATRFMSRRNSRWKDGIKLWPR